MPFIPPASWRVFWHIFIKSEYRNNGIPGRRINPLVAITMLRKPGEGAGKTLQRHF
jgi:hypothetical protein